MCELKAERCIGILSESAKQPSLLEEITIFRLECRMQVQAFLKYTVYIYCKYMNDDDSLSL